MISFFSHRRVIIASWLLGLAAWGACPSAASAVTYVLVTVDVESTTAGSPAADIWGRRDGDENPRGIGQIMDVLDRSGVKGTFFVNVYEAAKFGEPTLAAACREIHRRGHDLQLHTHPQTMFPYWSMSHADKATQVEILRKGRDLIRQWTDVEVVAHRAGDFSANADTLTACGEANIPCEFSWNAAWPRSAVADANIAVNAPRLVRGELCVPVTSYIELAAGPMRDLRFLDMESSSPQEFRKVFDELKAHDVRTAVLTIHSFSICRSPASLDTLTRLLQQAAADPQLRVVTASELYAIYRQQPDAIIGGGDWVPYTGYWLTYQRAWLRLGSGWKNVLFALLPPGVAVAALAAAVVRWRRRRRKARAAA